MNSTTLLEALNVMGPKLGLRDLTKNRSQIIQNVNRYRNILYNMFDELRLFSDYTACLHLDTYFMKCNNRSCETYRGITLPIDMDGVMSVWEGSTVLDLRSDWYEDREGRKSGISGDTEVIPLPDTSPTQYDLTRISRLRVRSQHPDDVGKVVFITVVSEIGEQKTLEFKLVDSTEFSIVDLLVCEIKQVVLPHDLCGRVELFQDIGDKLLSSYVPNITVPYFRRYKIITDCPSGCVYVKGTKKYVPICDDSDIVELGDTIVLEAAGRYLRYYESQETKELRRSQVDKELMLDMIRGILSRKRGKSQQDGPALTSLGRRRRKRNTLPGYRRA